MSGYLDPWADMLKGHWHDRMLKQAQPCHYGCGHLAPMNEPGKPWKAHKACAQNAAIVAAGDEVPPPVDPADIVGWDGEDRESKVLPRALGCGEPAPGQTSGRVCAGTGTSPSCQLCPSSPNYWRLSLSNAERQRIGKGVR